jgi:dTMP kinase
MDIKREKYRTDRRERRNQAWTALGDIGLLAPDLILFLDIAPEQARLRGGYREVGWSCSCDRKGNSEVTRADITGREREKGAQWMVIDARKERKRGT